MKQDLVWYAAYDDDINSKIFIEKLQKINEQIEGLLPQKIIPTVMIGWKLKLEFDVAYLVEDKDKMALMKLHLLQRSCLLKLFDAKNGKKVPLKVTSAGWYTSGSIKKTHFTQMIPVTTF
jgi:hypothetical protein